MKKQNLSLSQQNIEELQEILCRQRNEILSNGKTLRVKFNSKEEKLSEEGDIAVTDIEQGMQMRLGNRESLYFKKVEEALLRMKDGTYGDCLQCGSKIGLRRLEARPTAELCIECKEAAEKGESLNAEGRKHKSLGQMINFKA